LPVNQDILYPNYSGYKIIYSSLLRLLITMPSLISSPWACSRQCSFDRSSLRWRRYRKPRRSIGDFDYVGWQI